MFGEKYEFKERLMFINYKLNWDLESTICQSVYHASDETVRGEVPDSNWIITWFMYSRDVLSIRVSTAI